MWIGTAQSEPIRTARGGDIYGSGLPADVWKQMMDGALDGTPVEQFPSAGGQEPSKPSGGSYDILNPPKGPPQGPVIEFPPAPQDPKQVEIFPGLSIPVPG